MTVITKNEFRRPDPDADYEIIDVPIFDPDDPEIVVKSVNCCVCTPGGTGACTVENGNGSYVGMAYAWVFVHYNI